MFFLCKSDYSKRKEKSSLPARCIRKDKGRERMSLPVSFRGSLTLEAACVLPVFLFALIGIMQFFVGLSGVSGLGKSLHETAEKMAVYAYGNQDGSEVVSLLYASVQIRKDTEGLSGISLLHSSIMEDGNMIDLVAEYELKMRVPYITFGSIKGCQRARVRAWVGRQEGETGGEEGSQEEMVYVTVNGRVYHKNRECTHLRLSVHSVSKSEIPGLRNQSGGKYYPCESCGGAGVQIYITDTGDRYHGSVSCSGLKRGVLEVPLSQVEGWAPCSRCGG